MLMNLTKDHCVTGRQGHSLGSLSIRFCMTLSPHSPIVPSTRTINNTMHTYQYQSLTYLKHSSPQKKYDWLKITFVAASRFGSDP